MRRTATLSAIASLGLSGLLAVEPSGRTEKRRAPSSSNHSDRFHRSAGSIAQRNRLTGLPHEHKREIARRLRQRGQS